MPESLRLDGNLELIRESGPARWLVQIIKAGTSANRNRYSAEVLQEAGPLFEGRPLAVYELGDGRYSHLPPKVQKAVEGGLLKAVVGVLQDVHWDGDRQALVGEAVFTEGWLTDLLGRLKAAAKGTLKAFGLSITAAVEAVREGVETVVQRIAWVDSVDVVTSPAAGGEFLRALEGLAEGAEQMDEQKIRELIAEALRGLTPLTEERVTKLIAEAVKNAKSQDEAEIEAIKKATEEAKAETLKLKQEALDARTTSRVTDLCKVIMGGYAPETQDAAIRLVVSESEAEDTDEKLRERIKAFADKLPSPAKAPGRVQVIRESADKMRVAMAGLCGVADAKELDGVPPFRGLRQAYAEYTGDSELAGEPFARMREDTQLSTAFTVALGDALYRRLRKAYNREPWGERRLLTPPNERLTDFRKRNIVAIGGMTDIPTVSEGNPYTEATLPLEEIAALTPGKYGQLFLVSWEKMRNDDLRVILREIDEWGQAARRTFAKAVFACLSGNPTMLNDSKALFHTDHSNYSASGLALTYAHLITAQQAMWNQIRPNTSSEKLLYHVKNGGLLVIPVELEQTVVELLAAPFTPGATTLAQIGGVAVRGWFGPWPADPLNRVITNPFAADTSTWYLLADPNQIETIVAGFLDGREEPELITADAQQAFDMWFRDAIAYKLRWVWALTVSDYRGAYCGKA